MAFHEIDPKKFAFLLAHGTHEGELKKFFAESKSLLLLSGAKVQNIPHGRDERIRAICERLPPKTDDVLRAWFQKNISVAAPASLEEVQLYLGAHFEDGEPLPKSEARVICRSALTYIFCEVPHSDLLGLLQCSREHLLTEEEANSPSGDVDSSAEYAESHDPTVVNSRHTPANFQLAELLASIISGDESSIDNALSPFDESTQLLVEGLLRLRDGDTDAAREKLALLGTQGPEQELVRSALARASHQRDAGSKTAGIRTVIPQLLDDDPEVDVYEIVGMYTNETEGGAVFIQPLFLILEGRLLQLSKDDALRLFPDSGSVMTHRTALRKQLRKRELVHWSVAERDTAEGRTRFRLVDELNPLIEVVPIQVPSGDADEIRGRIQTYYSERREQIWQQLAFLLSDGVVIVSPKGADLARNEVYESPWQALGSLETWLIEGHQYYFESGNSASSHLDLSPLDAAFRRMLKDLDAEKKLTITRAQRSELTTRLRSQFGGEIAQRAKRIAASIDQISINEEELDAVFDLLRSHEEVRRRVDELVAKDYEARQVEAAGLQREISALRKKKAQLEKEGREIERDNRTLEESIAASVGNAFSKAVQEGASTLANAEIFQLLTSRGGTVARHATSVDTTVQEIDWIKHGAFSETDVHTRLSFLGINKRQVFLLSRLAEIASDSGVALILMGGIARHCVQALIREGRDAVGIVDIPMGLTSSDFLRRTLANLVDLQGLAFLNADLSPLEIYGAELIDSLVEQALAGRESQKAVYFSCLGGDYSLPLPKTLRHVSLVVNLELDWDESQQLLDEVDPESLLLLPVLRERIFDAVFSADEEVRKYIEPAIVRALLP